MKTNSIEIRVLYIGSTDTARLLEHGRHYIIRKHVYNNGHILVNVVDILGLNIRYTSEKAYRREWSE